MASTRQRSEPDTSELDPVRAAVVRAVVLIGNRVCEDELGHFMCWQVTCRRCHATLAPHVDARDLVWQIDNARRAHLCGGL